MSSALNPSILFFSIFLCLPSFGQDILWGDSLSASPKIKITKMGWLEGNWKSKGKEISIQESWTRNGAHSMMGVASIYERDKIILFEICTITEEEGTLILRLRHFSDQLKAWEEKDKPIEKKLLKIENSKFYFDGYTFEKVSKDEIKIHIQSNEADEKLTIPYIRI